MDPQDSASLEKKSMQYFRIAIVILLVFGLTFSLPAFFNWISLMAAMYFFFLSFWVLPRPQKTYTSYSTRNQGKTWKGQPSPGEAVGPDRGKRMAIIVVASIVMFFMFFIMIALFSGSDSEGTDETSPDQTENNYSDSGSSDYLTTGNDFYNSGEYDSAMFYYDKILETDPNNADATYNKGLCYYELQRFDESIGLLKRAYELGERTGFLCNELGMNAEKYGETSKAASFYKEALEQDSTLLDVYSKLALLEPQNASKYEELKARHQ